MQTHRWTSGSYSLSALQMSSTSPLFGNHEAQHQDYSSNLADSAHSVFSNTSNNSFNLKPLPHIVRPRRFTLPPPVQLKSPISAKMQRAHFWTTVLNVTDPRELSPGSSVSTDRGSHHQSPVPEMKIPRGIGMTGLPIDALNQLAAADLRRGRRYRSPRKGARPGPFRCETCWSSFGQRGDLMRHIRVTHLGERNYHCTICSTSFGRRSILNKHLKRHERDAAAAAQRTSTSSHAPRSGRTTKKPTASAGVLLDIMRDHHR